MLTLICLQMSINGQPSVCSRPDFGLILSISPPATFDLTWVWHLFWIPTFNSLLTRPGVGLSMYRILLLPSSWRQVQQNMGYPYFYGLPPCLCSSCRIPIRPSTWNWDNKTTSQEVGVTIGAPWQAWQIHIWFFGLHNEHDFFYRKKDNAEQKTSSTIGPWKLQGG